MDAILRVKACVSCSLGFSASAGYRAVICGMDPVCCESSSWMEAAKTQKLDRGPNQPFYQVLVNVNQDPNILVTYGNQYKI